MSDIIRFHFFRFSSNNVTENTTSFGAHID